MLIDSGIEIDAPAGVVWEVFSDVEAWPRMAESFTSVRGLDGPTLEVGHRFEIKQPGFPKLVWVVTDVVPGRSWTWEQRSPGGLALASHWVDPLPDGRTSIRQRIDQRGPIGGLVGRLVRKRSIRYMEAEAAGLKRLSEERARRDAATA